MSVVDIQLVVCGGAGKPAHPVDTDDRFALGWRGQHGRSFGIPCGRDGPCEDNRHRTECENRGSSAVTNPGTATELALDKHPKGIVEELSGHGH